MSLGHLLMGTFMMTTVKLMIMTIAGDDKS